MIGQDRYGYPLSAGPAATTAYNRGIGHLLALRHGALESVAESVAHDPTFALGHAALALLGYELCAPVDVPGRLRDAARHADRCTPRERSHVQAVTDHVRGDTGALVRHLAEHPRDALLLTTAVPTIAFSGVTDLPEEAWQIVERAAPAYGDDPWFTGLLAFVRQEQRRYDEAMELSCRALAAEPDAGHAAHARAHAHYETGDHRDGLAWMDAWVGGAGAGAESLTHFSWHAALHELSLGDLAAVRRRYDAQLRPSAGLGCRALVDSGSLLVRWALTPEATAVPDVGEVAEVVGRETLVAPGTPFLAMHAAVTLLALGDDAGLRSLAAHSRARGARTHREVVAPLADALLLLHRGRAGAAADSLAALSPGLRRLGGSDAQREIVEEVWICALLRAGRYDEARRALDARLDRRPSPRDRAWRATCRPRAVVRPG